MPKGVPGSQTLVNTYCKHCKCAFAILPYLINKRHYCSHKCYHESLKKDRTKICAYCKNPFHDQGNGRRKFCSKKCFADNARLIVIRTCIQCGKDFQPTERGKRRKEHLTCSRECLLKHKRRNMKLGTGHCQWCGAVLTGRKKDSNKFCSLSCGRKAQLHCPIGTERIRKRAGEDYRIYVKVKNYYESSDPLHGWVEKERLLAEKFILLRKLKPWEHVRFKDGNTLNCELDNLEVPNSVAPTVYLECPDCGRVKAISAARRKHIQSDYCKSCRIRRQHKERRLLSSQQVSEIRELLNVGMLATEIAKHFRVKEGVIYNIKYNKTYKDIS